MDADDLLRHGAFLRALAGGLLRGEPDAEDVVQEAYARALEHRPRRPRAWLGKVVTNLAIRSRIGGARRFRRERAAARPEAQPAVADSVARLEVQRRVVEAVLALREPYRSTVMHRYFDGLGTGEIAARADIPYETVRTRLGRALAELRRSLDAEGREWSLALAPLLVRPGSPIPGGLLVSAQKKAFLLALPLLGIAVGFAGHAAYANLTDSGVPRATAPARAPAASQIVELTAENEALRRENAELREQLARATVPPPAAGAPDRAPIDWAALLPLLRAEARTDPDRGEKLDAAQERRLDELIEELGRHELLREGMQVQDLWRLPAVGSEIAFAFAQELDRKLDPAVRDEIRRSIEAIESALPADPLEIELLAAVAEQVSATEEILARRSLPAVARQVAAAVAPLWGRRYWQTLHLGVTTKEELAEIVGGMLGELPADAKARTLAITERMTGELAGLRADLVREHGEEAVRAVLLEAGGGGGDEAVLQRRREREDYPSVERKIRAAIAKHQARFEREYYRSLPVAAQEEYAQVAATLMLFDLPR